MWEDLVPYRRRPNRYPAELREIVEIIASGRPKINIDDICDCLIDLWMSEQDTDDQDGVDRLNRKRRKLAYK